MATEVEAPTEETPYHLWKEDKTWVAKDERTGVATQGETRREALDNLDEAVELTREALEDDTPAPVPNAPWFEE